MKNICGVQSQIIYPPVVTPSRPVSHKPEDYYITVSRLDDTKGLELIVRACNRIGAHVKIVGSGSDARYIQRLRGLAGPTIEFMGRLSDKDIYRLYENAIAFLFTPETEDFGIAPLEAVSRGVPVIAYYGGGAKETLRDGKTGLFFYSYNEEALVHAMRALKPEQFAPASLYNYAKRFARPRFEREMKHYIERAMRDRDT